MNVLHYQVSRASARIFSIVLVGLVVGLNSVGAKSPSSACDGGTYFVIFLSRVCTDPEKLLALMQQLYGSYGPVVNFTQGLSNLLAAQMVAAEDNTSQIQQWCSDFQATFPGWYTGTDIDPSTYVCTYNESLPGPTSGDTDLDAFTSSLFLNSLYWSFSDYSVTQASDVSGYMGQICEYLSPNLLTALDLNTTMISIVTCGLGGLPVSSFGNASIPISSPTQLPEASFEALQEYLSQTFANELIVSQLNATGVQMLCTDFPTMFPNAAANVGLDTALIQNRLCNFTDAPNFGGSSPLTTIPSGIAADSYVSDPASHVYALQIVMASNAPSYLSYMCHNLQIAAMNSAGLNGTDILNYVCDTADLEAEGVCPPGGC